MRFPVVIRLRRSRILPAMVVGAAVLAALALAAWLPDIGMAGAAALMVCLVAVLAILDLRSGPATLVFLPDGSLQIANLSDGPGLPATLMPGGIAHPWLTIMRYRSGGGKAGRVVVAVDSLAGEDFRRLRVLLRNRAAVSEPGGAP